MLTPSVILLDEPASALDSESSESVGDMAESLCLNDGKAIVMVSHREFTPKRVKPTIISIVDGHVNFISQ